MKFTAWIDYPTMSIAIQVNDEGFHCKKFVDHRIVRDASKTCFSIEELKAFLLTLPEPPKEEISNLMDQLKLDVAK